MKKLFIASFLAVGIFASAQQKKKKKVYHKPYKTTTVQKNTVQEVKPIKDSIISPSVIETLNVKEEPKEEAYLNSVKKLEKKRGWVSNRNSYVSRGVWGYMKGVYSGNNKMYVMIELENKTNINYDVETITFITKVTDNSEKDLKNEDKVLTPIWQTEFETLSKKSKQKLIFVFDKFTLAENKDLIFVMDEKDGERTLRIPIAAKYVNGAEYIK
ncbi:hypothetical protein CMT22_17805 [Elizabethkingia anophelis]|nr:hypothetical protein [Elizabethkingia anophelis]